MTDTVRLAPTVHELRIGEIDLADIAVASNVHAVQMAAYALEAALLQVTAQEFPPLQRSTEDLQSDGSQYIAVHLGEELIAAASVELSDDGRCACIASFVVAPEFQRQGVGKKLLADIVRRNAFAELTVNTAVKNLPALGLYRQFEFVESTRGMVGSANLELVQLCRSMKYDEQTSLDCSH
jgi:ribosomal protein S18 acetylase RimI-like enzyme